MKLPLNVRIVDIVPKWMYSLSEGDISIFESSFNVKRAVRASTNIVGRI